MNSIQVQKITINDQENASLHDPVNRKVAMAQIHSNPGSIALNTIQIIKAINESREKGAAIVVLPELAIPGYCAMDLFYNRAFLKMNRDALEKVIQASKDMTVICGFVDEDQTKTAPGNKPWIYNAAAIIHDGKLIAVQHKELLPTYDVFDEKRYFKPAQTRSVVEIQGTKIGVAICEDLWSKDNDRDIVADLVNGGAEVLLSLNASPFSIGKTERRLAVLEDAAQKHGIPIVYTNLVGAQDGYDGEIIFDGSSAVIDGYGTVVSVSQSFTDSISIVDLDDLSKNITNHKPESDIVQIHDALVMGIKEFFSRKGLHTAYIGLSGGIDSAVVAALAVEALGAENVIGVTMPSHITSSETKSDALELADRLGIVCHERPIVEEYNAWLSGARSSTQKEPSSLTKQNKQARIRNSILLEYTNEHSGSCHLNTGNKTEVALGYFTLGGDAGGAISVLGDVNKLRVYELAKTINRIHGKETIPVTTITRAPSAELEVGQTDANSLPADYDILVPLVDSIIETDSTFEELVTMYGEETVTRTLSLIRKNEGKRRQLPPAIRITDHSFGIERRIPMDYPLETIAA